MPGNRILVRQEKPGVGYRFAFPVAEADCLALRRYPQPVVDLLAGAHRRRWKARQQFTCVAEGRFEHVGMPTHFDSFAVGQEHGSPVSEAYQTPYRFNGKVKQVRLEML